MLIRLLGLVSATVLLSLSPTYAEQASSPGAVAPPAGHSRFLFDPAILVELRSLWRASIDARRELVACIGGEARAGSWYITRYRLVPETVGDSLGIAATTSIEECGAPEWLGTVHTHVALRDGVRPYATFSGADRGIMRLWWRRWRTLGVFCLLYTDRNARCEADGVLVGGSGTRVEY